MQAVRAEPALRLGRNARPREGDLFSVAPRRIDHDWDVLITVVCGRAAAAYCRVRGVCFPERDNRGAGTVLGEQGRAIEELPAGRQLLGLHDANEARADTGQVTDTPVKPEGHQRYTYTHFSACLPYQLGTFVLLSVEDCGNQALRRLAAATGPAGQGGPSSSATSARNLGRDGVAA